MKMLILCLNWLESVFDVGKIIIIVFIEVMFCFQYHKNSCTKISWNMIYNNMLMSIAAFFAGPYSKIFGWLSSLILRINDPNGSISLICFGHWFQRAIADGKNDRYYRRRFANCIVSFDILKRGINQPDNQKQVH